ncbi:MAG: SEC-C domain-containing protein [Candidatus Gastranaerophilales bacterium]|nr:SEC-C domain-containing protein [Candidatus Gastranaerophilales bacterium]
MATLVDNLTSVSNTMENILDFVAKDDELSKDFEKYLEINDIEIETEKQFNNVIIQYMLDMKMQNGLRVLEYYKRNNPSDEKIINSLLESFCGVFKVNKINSSTFDVECLTSGAEFELMPMVKMSHLKQIGKYDFIEARILELDNIQYILEIYDVISEFNLYKATTNAIKYMLQAPKSAYYKNDEQKEKLKKSASEFYKSFIDCFKNEFIVTTNKKIDNLIEYFNNYRLGKVSESYEDFIEKPEKNRYLKIEELNTDDDNFIANAISGFSSHKETYDVALWIDKKRGLYVLPFFETFMKSFKEEGIEGRDDCIREFLTSDKVPPSVIKYAKENNENFFDVVNDVLNTDFTQMEELLFNTKAAFADENVFSPVTVLFNSDLFSNLVEIKKTETSEEKNKEIGRNDLCPCGSGLKYKKCCGKVV